MMAAVLAVLNPLANLLVIPLLQQNGAALVITASPDAAHDVTLSPALSFNLT